MDDLAAFLSQNVDEYCERLGAGLWAEPANFLTNLAFLGSAFWAWRTAQRAGVAVHGSVRWLVVLLAAIGIGSAAFHSVATQGAKICDVVPIGVFVLVFFGMWCRQALQWHWGRVAGAYVALALLSGVLMRLFAAPAWGGSQGYFGVLCFMAAFGVDQKRRWPARRPWLLYAAVVFAAALVARTADMYVCPFWPLGTHFLWHLLNASVCYAALASFIAAQAAQPRTDSGRGLRMIRSDQQV